MTITPKLAAFESPLIADVEAGERTRLASIEYWKEADQAIWHRWRPGAWQRVTISVTDLDDPTLTHGYFSSPALEIGWTYEVTIWPRDIDPNHPPNVDIPPRPLATLTLFVIRRRPEVRTFLTDETERLGGTYRQHYLVTSAPVRVCGAVGPQPPVLNPHDVPMLPEVIDETVSTALAASIDLLFEGLVPGNTYHEVIHLFDEFGNWEFVTRSFTALKRQISVQVGNIHIHDDSDDLSNGEATFTFELQVGSVADQNSWVTREGANYSNNNIESGKDVAPVPNNILNVPLEVVQPRHRDARFKVSALEDDNSNVGVAEEGDDAWGMKDLSIPSGQNEKVQNRAGTVTAGPGLNGFHYDVSFVYSVDYA